MICRSWPSQICHLIASVIGSGCRSASAGHVSPFTSRPYRLAAIPTPKVLHGTARQRLGQSFGGGGPWLRPADDHQRRDILPFISAGHRIVVREDDVRRKQAKSGDGGGRRARRGGGRRIGDSVFGKCSRPSRSLRLSYAPQHDDLGGARAEVTVGLRRRSTMA